MKVRSYTMHLPWIQQWSELANEGALGVGSRKPGNIPGNAYSIADGLEILELRVLANFAGKNATMHVYMARRGDQPNTFDDICFVGTVAMVSGTQISSRDTFYVHSMTLTQQWIVDIQTADAAANNGMSRIMFDCVGYDTIFIKLSFGDSTKWYIDISGASKI